MWFTGISRTMQIRHHIFHLYFMMKCYFTCQCYASGYQITSKSRVSSHSHLESHGWTFSFYLGPRAAFLKENIVTEEDLNTNPRGQAPFGTCQRLHTVSLFAVNVFCATGPAAASENSVSLCTTDWTCSRAIFCSKPHSKLSSL